MTDEYESSGEVAPEAVPRGDMRKIWGLLIALAAFVIYVAAFVVPQQGGLIPTSVIYADHLANASPLYLEQLPIQLVDLGAYGRSIFIAFVMEAHVVFADLHLGGSWVILSLLVLWLYSKKTRFLHLGRSMTLFNVILFSVGATFPIGGLLFFIALFPTFATNTFTVYWWPLLIETMTFGAEIFFLYALWFTWGKISSRWHLLIAILYPLDVFLQTFMIDTLAAGMLTPKLGVTTIDWFKVPECFFCMPMVDYLQYWFNATFWQLQFHRVPAAASAFGFIIAFVAVLHFRDRKDPASRKFWDWAAAFGIFWGLLGLAFQPISGLSYMFQIMTHQNAAFAMVMTGPRGWEMLMMVGMVSILIITVLVYFLESRDRLLTKSENLWIRRTFLGLVGVMIVVMFILVNPGWIGGIHGSSPGAIPNPIGQMYWKHLSFMVLMGVTLVMLGIDALILGKRKESIWGRSSNAARWAAGIAGVLGSTVVLIMGYVRESGRAPWVLYNIIPVPGNGQYPTPIPMPIEFTLWAVILPLAFTIFWYVSRVTAEHPEEAEKV